MRIFLNTEELSNRILSKITTTALERFLPGSEGLNAAIICWMNNAS